MAETLEIAFEIPQLSLVNSPSAFHAHSHDQVGLSVQQLTYHRGDTDLWRLPAAQPALPDSMDVQSPIPLLRCHIPIPAPGEVALYRCSILKTGTTLDAEGQRRDDHLHATEEELLFLVISEAPAGQDASSVVDNHLILGAHSIVIPVPGKP